MEKTLRIALAQINCTVGDITGNGEKILSYIDKGREKGADIIVFPEMAICGYPPEDLLLKDKFIKDNLATLNNIAGSCHGITAVIGFADSGAEGVYNAAAVINSGRVEGVYHKMILPNYGVFDEKRYFKRGDHCPTFDLDGFIFGVNICEDIWHASGPARQLTEGGGASLIINLNASPFHAGKHLERKEILGKRVSETGAAIAYTNLVGGQDELVFDGGSMLIGSNGIIQARAPQFKEALIIADLPHIEAKTAGLSQSAIVLEGKITKKEGLISAPKVAELEPLEEIYSALVMGSRDYVEKNGFEGVIIGLSGGIDSALTAAIAMDALGSDRITGVAMPSRYSSKGSIDDAKALAENIGLKFHIIPIEPVYAALTSSLAPVFEGYEEDVTEENIQARVRGNILMAMSNKFGRMLLTTGNKSEVAVGYSTLYGDMAGGFNILKDVPKTLVYELSRYVNKKAGRELIPESSITKPPSAELRPDQVDQDSLPPYDILDSILESYVEEHKSSDDIIALGYEPELVKKIIRLVDLNEYKRRQAAPGIKITPTAFGRDRRMPIVNKYKELESNNG